MKDLSLTKIIKRHNERKEGENNVKNMIYQKHKKDKLGKKKKKRRRRRLLEGTQMKKSKQISEK